MTRLDQAEMTLDRARSAVVNAIAKRLGVDRSYRLWHEIESEARNAVTAWGRSPRTPSDDFETLLEGARNAEASVAAAKAAIRAAQGAVIEAGIAKLRKPTDPTKVVARLTDAATGLHFEVTLDATQIRVLSPSGKLPLPPLAAE